MPIGLLRGKKKHIAEAIAAARRSDTEQVMKLVSAGGGYQHLGARVGRPTRVRSRVLQRFSLRVGQTTQMQRAFLNSGVSPNLTTAAGGVTALMMAAAPDRHTLADVLLAAGADSNAVLNAIDAGAGKSAVEVTQAPGHGTVMAVLTPTSVR